MSKQNRPILIVEDSDDDFEALVRALKKAGNLGNPIHRCVTGDEALAYLRNVDNEPPGLILLDLNMPGKDGRTTLREIKQDEALNQTPVVVLTTSGDDRDVHDCYSAGANTYIRKPVDLENLFQAMARLTEFWFDVSIIPQPEDDG